MGWRGALAQINPNFKSPFVSHCFLFLSHPSPSLASVPLSAQWLNPLDSLAQRDSYTWSGLSCTDSLQCCSSGHCYLLDDDPQTCAVSHEVKIHTMFSSYFLDIFSDYFFGFNAYTGGRSCGRLRNYHFPG